MLAEDKIILVVRATRMADLKARFATKLQAKFYVSRLGGDFADYEKEDAAYQEAIAQARQILAAHGRVQIVQRAFLPNYVFGPREVVVALGQDGLVANTLKYLDGQPLIGVNPDPQRWDGKLLPFAVRDLGKIVPEVQRRRRALKQVTMAKVTLNTGLSLYAVNDFFVGARTHVSARYRIQSGAQRENQSSSGVVISTGLGSSGWLKSLLTGATVIAQAVPRVMAAPPPALPPAGRVRHSTALPAAAHRTALGIRSEFAWDADYLFFTVREPFPTKQTGTSLVFGRVTPQQPLVVQSQMGEAGVIFSDGIEQDFLEFNSGTSANIGIAERRGNLVV